MKEAKRLAIVLLLQQDKSIQPEIESWEVCSPDGDINVIAALQMMGYWKTQAPKKLSVVLLKRGYLKSEAKKAKETGKNPFFVSPDDALDIIEEEVRKKLSKGIAYNDIPGYGGFAIEKGTNYRAYNKWQQMLRRVFTIGWHNWKPTYKDCTIDPAWLIFSNFKKWYDEQPLAGQYCELDKDIIIQGNKHYSPETCVLVTAEINTLMRSYGKGKLLRGVTSIRKGKRFKATLTANKEVFKLGEFDTEIEAHQAYVHAKEANIQKVAHERYAQGLICARTHQGLLNYRYQLSDEAGF
jgi:hypothetical protein